MSNSSGFSFAKYEGEINKIDQFYQILGVEVDQGIVKFKNFEIFYGTELAAGESFQLVIMINHDIDETEQQLIDIGYKILDRGFDGSGPYFVTNDPAGLLLRVTVTNEGMALFTKGLKE